MPFLRINGVLVDVEYGSFKEEAVDVGDLSARTLAARLAESRSTKVRRWTFRTTPLIAGDVAERLEKWIEGFGQAWRFDGNTRSGNGVTNSFPVGGTLTNNAGGGAYGGCVTVPSGGRFGVDMSNKLGIAGGWDPTVHGWTLMGWREFIGGETAAAGWHHVILRGAATFTRGSSSNPIGVDQWVDGVLGNYGLGRCIGVSTSDPGVSLHGYDTANNAAAIDWDDFVFLPFRVPSTEASSAPDDVDWIEQIYDQASTAAWSKLPRVVVSGDYFNDVPVEVIGRVRSKQAVQVIDAAGVENERRVLDVALEEWVA
jgi:hypothetical protein